MMTFWCGKGVGLGTIIECGARRAVNYNRLERLHLTLLLRTFPLAGPQPWDNPPQSLLPSRKGMA